LAEEIVCNVVRSSQCSSKLGEPRDGPGASWDGRGPPVIAPLTRLAHNSISSFIPGSLNFSARCSLREAAGKMGKLIRLELFSMYDRKIHRTQ
jgi:hypothetical protein